MWWVLGIVFLFFLIVLWQFYLLLFAVAGVAAVLAIIFLTVRATMLTRTPGVFEIKEQNGNYFCTVHPSAYEKIGLSAVFAPLVGYIAGWLFAVNSQMSHLDFLDVLGLLMLLPPIYLVFKLAPRLEWFGTSPLERFAKKATTNLRIPEYLIQSDLAGREMASLLSGQWSPSFTTRYFQRLEMEPSLMTSEEAQLDVIKEFERVGMQDIRLLSNAEDHWKAVDAMVKIASDTATVLKDEQMKKDAAFLSKSLRNPELSDLLEFRDFAEFEKVIMAIEQDAEKLLEGKLPPLSSDSSG